VFRVYTRFGSLNPGHVWPPRSVNLNPIGSGRASGKGEDFEGIKRAMDNIPGGEGEEETIKLPQSGLAVLKIDRRPLLINPLQQKRM